MYPDIELPGFESLLNYLNQNKKSKIDITRSSELQDSMVSARVRLGRLKNKIKQSNEKKFQTREECHLSQRVCLYLNQTNLLNMIQKFAVCPTHQVFWLG